MSITYPITLPTSPGFSKAKFTMESAVALSESPFTFEQQTYVHQGQRWRVMISLPKMRRSQAAAWIAAMAQLNGRAGTFLLGDPDAKSPQGQGTGAPEVSPGADAMGQNTVRTAGWTAGITGILKAGDHIGFGTGSDSRMYMLVQDATSDGSGNATLTVWPNLRRASVNGESVFLTYPKTQFRLDAPFAWDADEVSTFEVSFSATEAL